MPIKRKLLTAFILSLSILAASSGCQPVKKEIKTTEASANASGTEQTAWLSSIPEYNGEPATEINGNKPYFTKKEIEYATETFENYSDLDAISDETMPTETRDEIGMIKPSGWHTVKYQNIPDRYLYNRCHLIGFAIAGENANEKNLITGTRYFNTEGMLPYEKQVIHYIGGTGRHVLYRVTPVFKKNDLVARGVLMEAQSTDGTGKNSLSFCVFIHNVQPGIEINYATGDSEGPEYTGGAKTEKEPEKQDFSMDASKKYVMNTSTMKFHKIFCHQPDKIHEIRSFRVSCYLHFLCRSKI